PETGHALAWLGFMVEGGQFVRYDVGNPELVAPGGGKVGMSADEIRALYPDRVTSLPHHYVPGGEYLRVPAEQGEGFLVFETDADGTVTTWRGGLAGPGGYIEWCAGRPCASLAGCRPPVRPARSAHSPRAPTSSASKPPAASS